MIDASMNQVHRPRGTTTTEHVVAAGHRRSPIVILYLAAAAAAGCGASNETLLPRARFDLNCPAGQIQILDIDAKTRGVTGCGKRTTYLYVCDTTGLGPMNCRWVANPADAPASADAMHTVGRAPFRFPIEPAPSLSPLVFARPFGVASRSSSEPPPTSCSWALLPPVDAPRAKSSPP